LHNFAGFSEDGRTIWTWNVERDILDCPDDVSLIPDVRFPDELEMLRKFEYIFINILRPFTSDGSASTQASEIGRLCNYERLYIKRIESQTP
jgi:hypothetical protein